MSADPGSLYIVATPIGNLGDITRRAVEVLADVDVIAAEDTRRSRILLDHLGINTPMLSLHEHNERRQVSTLLARLVAGESIALVSDAGTPLISDPGYHLVQQARKQGLAVVPIPGPSALVAALSVCGLPVDHFRFEGFLPHKASARRKALHELAGATSTLIFYESSHRIQDCLQDMCQELGEQRQAVLARELTKTYETVLQGTLEELFEQVGGDENQRKGEFVLIVAGQERDASRPDIAVADDLLTLLLPELSVKQASKIAATYLGLSKNEVYKRALVLQNDHDPSAK